MANRTAAGIFGDIFNILAETPTNEIKVIANRIWNKTKGYDFCYEQLECDDSLLKLDLAKMGKNPDYPEDSDYEEIVIYKGDIS